MNRYYVKCQVDYEKFDQEIFGTLVNPKQIFEVEILENKDLEKYGLKRVIPIISVDVPWVDALGDLHTSHYSKSSSFMISDKFIEEY